MKIFANKLPNPFSDCLANYLSLFIEYLFFVLFCFVLPNSWIIYITIISWLFSHTRYYIPYRLFLAERCNVFLCVVHIFDHQMTKTTVHYYFVCIGCVVLIFSFPYLLQIKAIYHYFFCLILLY